MNSTSMNSTSMNSTSMRSGLDAPVLEPDLSGKRVLVVGLGVSGQSMVNLLLSRGVWVYAYDQDEGLVQMLGSAWADQSVEYVDARRIPGDLDLCVLSPGVSPGIPLVELCKKHGVCITGEFELAARFVHRPCIAVTGTNGKTTVVHMIHHILTECGHGSDLAGNVGTPVSELVLQGKGDGKEPVVMEVSSFQCETVEWFHPKVAVMTNLAPDHLDRYERVEDYYAAKMNLVRNQTADEALWTAPGVEGQLPGWVRASVRNVALTDLQVEGLFCVEGKFVLRDGGHESRHPCSSSFLQLLPQQRLNALCAMGACMHFGVRLAEAAEVLSRFQPLPHRLEFVGEVKGAHCYNDSKATNIHAMQAALESVRAPIRLIAGGRGKGEPLQPVRSLIQEKVCAAYLIGESAGLFAEAWRDLTAVYRERSLKDAVFHALEDVEPGETVLLSPGCASWDMFQSYAERGERFRQYIEEYAP